VEIDSLHCFATRSTDTDDRDAWHAAEQANHSLSRRRLVVHDEHSDRRLDRGRG
jgi:hypothetical protein